MKRIDLHLTELRWRFISFLLSFFFTFFASSIYSTTFLSIILKSLSTKENARFIFTNISEAFQTNLNFSILFSFVILIPFIFYHGFCFFAPGFFKKERRSSLHIFCLFLLFFFSGGFFGWKIILPIFWEFFSNFEFNSTHFSLTFEPRISSTIQFIFFIILGNQLLFGMIYLYILIYIYYPELLVNLFFFGENRIFFYFFFFLLASLICPPEISIQILITLNFILLFECSIFFNLVALSYTKIKLKKKKES